MTVTAASGRTFRKDSRLPSSFVYMLLCQDEDGPIYVKIGLSDEPYRRLQALRNGCPVTPRRFATCAVPGRIIAKRVEHALLSQLAPWRTQGEWLKFDRDEKADFNAGWQEAFRKTAPKGWPLEWTHIPVGELIKWWQQKKVLAQVRFNRMSQAKRDFLQHSSCKT